MNLVVLKDIDNILLRKRALIESVNDQLKNSSQIQHTHHRSIVNFMINVIAGLISYSWQEKKPSLNLRQHKHPRLVEHENTFFLAN